MFDGGAAFIVTSSVIMVDAMRDALDRKDDNNKITRSSILAVTGIAAMVGNIPLLISAHKNRKKSVSLAITNKAIPIAQRGWWSYQSYPALSLKINFGRN